MLLQCLFTTLQDDDWGRGNQFSLFHSETLTFLTFLFSENLNLLFHFLKHANWEVAESEIKFCPETYVQHEWKVKEDKEQIIFGNWIGITIHE